MLHYLLVFIIFIHGLLHLMGYSKAFQYSGIKHIQSHISRPIGILWIMGCLLFIVTGILVILYNEYWQIAGLTAIVSSQIVINIGGKNVRYATAVNVLILTAIIVSKCTNLFDK